MSLLQRLTARFPSLLNGAYATATAGSAGLLLVLLLVAGRYPVSVYPPALRLLFTFVLPVAFLTTVPAEALIGRGAWPWAAGSLLVAFLALVGTLLFWHFALRHYTSASS